METTFSETYKYFRLAKKLNSEKFEELLQGKMIFRGNEKSLSLISLDTETPEIGISNLETEEKALEKLIEFKPVSPKRNTPEKELQAWIIYEAMKNDWKLPFDQNIKYLTSELAIQQKDRIVNDILGIDVEGKLCIIELKSSRDNYVKKQTINFEMVVNENREYFRGLLEIISTVQWNGEIRKIAVWPELMNDARPIPEKFAKVEEVNYTPGTLKGGFIFRLRKF